MNQELPFHDKLVPIIDSIDGLKSLLNQYHDSFFCLYSAYKSEEDWQKSTSRRYMNQVLPGFIYLPVNIQKSDHQVLRQIYEMSEQSLQVVAINQTQPHKSNPVIMDWFKDLPDVPTNIDALVKDGSGKLKPYDLNGPAFVGWFVDEVASFKDKTVVIVGVGGVGEPIARQIAQEQPRELLLIDPTDKQALAQELSVTVKAVYFQPGAPSVAVGGENLIVINAAGKEGLGVDSAIDRVLQEYASDENIFVDLRPQLDIGSVQQATELGWRAFTGYGMNARNDYKLLCRIAELIKVKPPTFEVFKQLVAKAS